jgi:hydrogenase nickel incorporation protein HypA/HybF
MHEIGIAQNTLDLAVKAARDSGASQIHSIKLRVGAMTGVVPDALRFAFDALRSGTMAESAELVIETVPVCAWCANCQKAFEPADILDECPKCHEAVADLRGGLELELASLEIT